MNDPLAKTVKFRYGINNKFYAFECPIPVFKGSDAILRGSYFPPGVKVKSHPTVLDVGGNVGAYTCYIAATYPGATIHVYEPDPANFGYLKANAEAAGAKPFFHNVAVTNQYGNATLYPGLHNCGEQSLYDVGEQDMAGGQVVDTIPAEALPPCDILKLDTEGSEVTILEGYPYLGEVQVVALEWHRAEDKWTIGHLLVEAGLHCIKETPRRPDRGELVFAR